MIQKNNLSFLIGNDGWFGAFLNFYCPGLTQVLFNESRLRGLLMISLSGAGLFFFLFYLSRLIFNPDITWNFAAMIPVIAIIIVMILLWVVSLIDGYRLISVYSTSSKEKDKKKSMGLALFLTLLLPSLGHFYLWRVQKGAFFLGFFLTLNLLTSIAAVQLSNQPYVVVAILEPLIWTVFFFWLFRDLVIFFLCASSDKNEWGGNQRFYNKLFAVLGLFIFISHIPFDEVIPRYIVSLSKVATASMEPALLKGDWVLVRRVSNPNLQLKREDIVIFKLSEKHEEMAKRILGLPGDTITFAKEGHLLINGVPFKRQNMTVVWPETFDGKDMIVPHGYLFVIGDNPQYSLDSFKLGPIPLKFVTGRVLKVVHFF